MHRCHFKREHELNQDLIRTLAVLHLKALAEWTPGWTAEKDLTEPLIDCEIQKLAKHWGKPWQLVITVKNAAGEMIGYHWASCTSFPERLPGMPWYGAQIHGLWVDPEWRRRGIAKNCKNMLEDWAREVGCKRLTTQNDLRNPTGIQQLNEAMGYQAVRVVMQKELW
jgi:GNAT superfamily N-acetyltransferase